MIFKNLWRRKTRTFLTALGVALGVAAVISLTAFGQHFVDIWLQVGASPSADLQVSQKEAMMLAMSAVDDAIGEELRAIPGVQSVVGTVVGIVQLRDSPYFLTIGEDPKGFTLERYRLIDGDPIAGKRQIMLGALTARNFKKMVGDKFGINEATYTVVGVYETGASFEDGGAVIPLAEAKLAFDKRAQVSFFNLKLRNPADVDEVKATIETRWPDLTATRSGDVSAAVQQFGMFRSFGWFLGIFAALVGGLGMMNTLLMSVLERTREIGVLRAVGWRRWRIIGMIMGESMALSVVGGVMGVGLGWLLLQLPSLSPTLEHLLAAPLTLELVAESFAIAILLGAVGGAYPAWRAARLEPAEAMRREGGATGSLRMGVLWRILARVFGQGALRNLFRRPARTLITVAGLGLGVGFIVSLIAVVDGFSALFGQLGAAGEVELMVEQAKASDASFSVIDERLADKIAMRDDIRSVSKLVLGMSSAPGLPFFIVFGLDPHEQFIEHYRVVEGSPIDRPKEIMLGRTAARSLKREVGELLAISGSSYRISGIFENGVAFEDSGGVMSLTDAQKLFRKPGQVSFMGISVMDPSRAGDIAADLEQVYPELMVAKVSKFTERMNDLQVTNAMLDALILITMLVGGVVMMNAMLMSVFERTQEIGVLRALGWSRARVVGMVAVEALALSILSAAAGIGIGVVLASAFALEPTMGAFLLPTYSPELFLRVTVLAVVLSVVGAVYPTLRAAGLRPVEALRYE